MATGASHPQLFSAIRLRPSVPIRHTAGVTARIDIGTSGPGQSVFFDIEELLAEFESSAGERGIELHEELSERDRTRRAAIAAGPSH